MFVNFKIIISLFYLVAVDRISASNLNLESDNVVVTDFPSHKDLHVYLASLDRIIEFCAQNTSYLNIDLLFGLFLVNVNLQPFLKDDSLPEPLRSHLTELLDQIESLRRIADVQMMENQCPERILALLFTNTTAWSGRVMKLNIVLPENLPSNSNTQDNDNFLSYWNDVKQFDNVRPDAQQSDMCMASLAESEENLTKFPFRCELRPACYEALLFGTHFGYGLTHRLLLLLNARLSRNCAIFSPSRDEILRNSFCDQAYKEAMYIAANGFMVPDLMLEQIALCTLDGHAQFLRSSWISNILHLQKPNGCFTELSPGLNSNRRVYRRLAGECNGHLTAVAAATLAAALRFIFENGNYFNNGPVVY